MVADYVSMEATLWIVPLTGPVLCILFLSYVYNCGDTGTDFLAVQLTLLD